MNTVFEILPSAFESEKCYLACEVSNEGFSYCIKDESQKKFLGLGIYHFDTMKPAVGFPIELQVLFHQSEIFSKKFEKVCVVYSYPQSVLIPFSFYNREKNQEVLNLMFGDVCANEVILSDVIPGESLYNCYRLPSATADIIKNQFPEAPLIHQYSLLLKKSAENENRLSVIFYTQKVVVHLYNEGKHQLLNSYNYTTAKDICYILLNICRQLNVQKIPLTLSGLIEKDSSLYNEIYKYFDDIRFAGFRDGYSFSDEIAKYPSHYFSHLFDIDSCE